jgi:hypothetical protein
MKLKVLLACEESQTVCKEFRALGHEAYSCDLLPCSGGHPEWHLQQDVTELLKQKWDLIIAFPTCTDLAVSGAAYFARKIADGTQQASVNFFLQFTEIDCEYVAIENPVGIMSRIYRKPDQIVHPYFFGDEFRKKTCLWLKGLPKLEATNMVSEGDIKNGYPVWMFNNNKKHRSKTFPGFAKAMAIQWAEYILKQKTT